MLRFFLPYITHWIYFFLCRWTQQSWAQCQGKDAETWISGRGTGRSCDNDTGPKPLDLRQAGDNNKPAPATRLDPGSIIGRPGGRPTHWRRISRRTVGLHQRPPVAERRWRPAFSQRRYPRGQRSTRLGFRTPRCCRLDYSLPHWPTRCRPVNLQPSTW